MKRFFLNFVLAGSLFAQAAYAAERAESEKIVVTIKPLHSLVAGVMGDTGMPELVVFGNVSPHEFQLKPSQMKDLQQAKVVFYAGDSFETFLAGALKSMPASAHKIALVQAAKIQTLPQRKGGAWEADDHEVNNIKGEDLHVWLDPTLAKKLVQQIAVELSATYPGNSKKYQENANKLLSRLDELDTHIKAELEGVKGKNFIVFHDAYQYFEKHYGLSAGGSITLEPNELPSPKRIAQLREKLQKSNAVCVFREPFFSDKLIGTITSGLNVKTSTLDPEATGIEAGGDLYFKMMEEIAKSIKTCLNG